MRLSQLDVHYVELLNLTVRIMLLLLWDNLLNDLVNFRWDFNVIIKEIWLIIVARFYIIKDVGKEYDLKLVEMKYFAYQQK